MEHAVWLWPVPVVFRRGAVWHNQDAAKVVLGTGRHALVLHIPELDTSCGGSCALLHPPLDTAHVGLRHIFPNFVSACICPPASPRPCPGMRELQRPMCSFLGGRGARVWFWFVLDGHSRAPSLFVCFACGVGLRRGWGSADSHYAGVIAPAWALPLGPLCAA